MQKTTSLNLTKEEAALDLINIFQLLPKTEVMHKFVHFNPMESFLDRNFLRAWLDFCDLMGIQPVLSRSEYARYLKTRNISQSKVILELPNNRNEHSENLILQNKTWRSFVQKNIKLWEEELHFDLFYVSEREWTKELASLTDQGISLFSYLNFVEQNASEQVLTPKQRGLYCIEKMLSVCETHLDAYYLLKEFIIQNRGWFSFLKTHKQNKNLWLEFDLDELDALEKFVTIITNNFKYLNHSRKFKISFEQQEPPNTVNRENFILHSLLEQSVHEEIVSKINSEIPTTLMKSSKKFSLLFCLDDRECSMRRHLETLSSDIQTFGVPGFFGIPLNVINHEKLQYKSCPPLVSPSIPIYIQNKTNRMLDFFFSALNLLPGINILFKRKLLFVGNDPEIYWNELDSKEISAPVPDIKFKSFNELAEYVAKFLKAFGVVPRNSEEKKIIGVVSHGGSSINNPYFAAYDCAACSGNPGDLNARTLALIANDSRIRTMLSTDFQINLNQNILFLAIRHDTTTDEFKFFEMDISPSQISHFSKEIESLKTIIIKASGKNALERCNKFEYKRNLLTEKLALKEVRKRGHSFFEPRPELGHAGCIAIIICPRAWIQHINFDRRAFLISYDPDNDPKLENLENILQAILPVCTGISYDYFCSRMSKHIYGTGSKLSTSIEGLIGITQGSQGTLLSGLSWQMIEAHQPVRPILITCQSEESLRNLMNRNKLISDYIQGNWVRLAHLKKDNSVLQASFSTESWTEFEDLII